MNCNNDNDDIAKMNNNNTDDIDNIGKNEK